MDEVKADVNSIRVSVTQIEDRMAALETRVQDMDNTIATRISDEVGQHTKALKEDIDMLECKVNDTLDTLNAKHEKDIQQEEDDRSVIIKNMRTENDDDLVADVVDLFINMLQVAVVVTQATRFKAYGKHIAPIKVTLGSLENKVDVLRAKRKTADSDKMKDVRIESCASKADIINKQNWSLIISELKLGKKLRVAGSGRIVRNKDTGTSGDSQKGKKGETAGTMGQDPGHQRTPDDTSGGKRHEKRCSPSVEKTGTKGDNRKHERDRSRSRSSSASQRS